MLLSFARMFLLVQCGAMLLKQGVYPMGSLWRAVTRLSHSTPDVASFAEVLWGCTWKPLSCQLFCYQGMSRKRKKFLLSPFPRPQRYTSLVPLVPFHWVTVPGET